MTTVREINFTAYNNQNCKFGKAALAIASVKAK